MTVLDKSGKLVSVSACLIGFGIGVVIGYSASFPIESAARSNEPITGVADQLTRLEASIAVLRNNIAAMDERVAQMPQGMNPGMSLRMSEESKAPSSGAHEIKEEPVRSDANLSAQATANAVLDDAISMGRWTASDRVQLREHFGALATPDKLTLLHKLAEAINSEQLSVRDLEGPPFY